MCSKTMDETMEEVGSFGRFQILLLFFSLPCIPMATWSMLLMVFGKLEPDWWCLSHDLHDISVVHFLNNSLKGEMSTSYADLSLTTSSAAWRGDYNLTNDSGLPFANSSRKNCGAPDGPNGVCEKFVFAPGMNTLVSQFQLVCGLSWVPPMIISLQMVGVLIGCGTAGIVSDGIGRKKTIVAIMALHVVFNFISAFSISWKMFAVFRMVSQHTGTPFTLHHIDWAFHKRVIPDRYLKAYVQFLGTDEVLKIMTLIGLSLGGIYATVVSYSTEFIGIKWRMIIGSIPLWGIGSLSYSLLVWALPDWSYQQIVTASISAACLSAWLFLPESVRWLSVKGRVTEVHAVLVKIAKWNRRTPPTLQSMQELCVESDSTQKKYHYLHLFSSWKMVKLSVLQGWLWFSCALTYHGISFGVDTLSGNFYTNFILMSAVEIWPPLFIYPLSNFFGRRWTMFGSLFVTFLSALASVVISLLMSPDETASYIIGLYIVSRCAVTFGWNTLRVYMAEQYPTVVRSIASGYANTISRFGSILVPYILTFDEPYMFYAIISGVMAISCIAPLLMHETKGRPLSDELPPTFWQRKSDRDKKKNGLFEVTEE